jgi:hypothetical protein
MPFCQHCGKPISANEDFCPECGQKTHLEKVVERVVEKAPKVVQVENRSEGNQKVSDSQVYGFAIYSNIIGVVGAFLTSVAIIIFFFLDGPISLISFILGLLCFVYSGYLKFKYKRNSGIIVHKGEK